MRLKFATVQTVDPCPAAGRHRLKRHFKIEMVLFLHPVLGRPWRSIDFKKYRETYKILGNQEMLVDMAV